MTRPIAMSILPAAAAGAKVGLGSSTVNHSQAVPLSTPAVRARRAAVLQTAVGRIATLGVSDRPTPVGQPRRPKYPKAVIAKIMQRPGDPGVCNELLCVAVADRAWKRPLRRTRR
jgi:hypothetical protein